MLDGEFWSKAQEAFDGDDKTFLGKFADNFFEDPDWGISMYLTNMIYVIDPSNTSVSVTGKETYPVSSTSTMVLTKKQASTSTVHFLTMIWLRKQVLFRQ